VRLHELRVRIDSPYGLRDAPPWSTPTRPALFVSPCVPYQIAAIRFARSGFGCCGSSMTAAGIASFLNARPSYLFRAMADPSASRASAIGV
jgi:hypothetical protein